MASELIEIVIRKVAHGASKLCRLQRWDVVSRADASGPTIGWVTHVQRDEDGTVSVNVRAARPSRVVGPRRVGWRRSSRAPRARPRSSNASCTTPTSSRSRARAIACASLRSTPPPAASHDATRSRPPKRDRATASPCSPARSASGCSVFRVSWRSATHDGAAGQRARAAIQRAEAERCRETYAALEATSGCFPVATSSKAV